MLEKLKAAIDQARADGREVPAIIEELFVLVAEELSGNAAKPAAPAQQQQAEPASS